MSADLEALANRFLGVDVQCRRVVDGWPLPWRARVVVANKNEQAEYRPPVFGSTMDEAIQRLVDVTKARDAQKEKAA